MKKKNKLAIFLLLLPALVIMLALVFYPIIRTFEYSLYDFNLTKPQDIQWIGLENYSQIFKDKNFYIALQNTLIMSFFIIVFSFFASIFVAMLLNRKTKVTPLLTSIAIIPWTLPPLVNGIIWEFIFYPGYGLMNKVLMNLHLIDQPILWSNNRYLVMLVVALIVSWRVVPLCAIIILAQLQNIPHSYYEVAQLEGSSHWQTFKDITLPILKPSLIVVLMQITIAAFNVFDEIVSFVGYSLTSQTLLIYNYMNLFSFLDFGYGSAITYVIMIFSAIISIFYIRSLIKRGES